VPAAAINARTTPRAIAMPARAKSMWAMRLPAGGVPGMTFRALGDEAVTAPAMPSRISMAAPAAVPAPCARNPAADVERYECQTRRRDGEGEGRRRDHE